ncbi:phage holin family protein [Flavobacterium nackdongense]|uniref:Phage holin family protein n=1 Tax=Flavobacterium nackdongense TaxID=2547394 RepID=A0A4P6YDJ9_9FLAO|nr:phage holin family protein [Flavobacterium nackdongense]QBN18845.1 phage holin family protein [Flavobacterium nackdongense]
MKLLFKIFITAGLVMLISSLMSTVEVDNFTTAVIVAAVLGLLNIFVKPILTILTLPATILTLGLFLFVVNGIIIMLCSELVGGFKINSFWTAILFSVILSICQSIVFNIIGEDN